MRSRRSTAKHELLAMLSELETTRVVDADVQYSLAAGEEYVDLDHLERGLQRATAVIGSFGQIVPKRAINADTWSRIIAAFPKR